MEVSKKSPAESGQKLIDTVVSLTGLPEPLIHKEMEQILELTGQNSSELTLDQLRVAMLAYLEAMQKDLLAEETPSSD